MALQFEARLQTGQGGLDTDLRDLQVIDTAQGSFLYAATGLNGGVSVYELTTPGPAQLVDTFWFSNLSATLTDTRLDLVEVEGSARLLLGTSAAGGLVHCAFAPGEGPGAAEESVVPSSIVSGAWTCGPSAPGPYRIYLADQDSGGVKAYDMTGAGLVEVAEDAGGGALAAGARLMTLAQTESGPVLVAVDGGGVAGLASYRVVEGQGLLQLADQSGAAQGIGVSAPTALEHVAAFGEAWVILAAAGSQTLSVLKVDPDGTLSEADHVMDTLATRFGTPQALSVVEAEGHVLIFAGGGDDGLAVFTLLPDGRMVHLQSLEDAAGLGLGDIAALHAARIGTGIAVFAAGEQAPGLARLSWSLDNLGAVLQADAAVSGELQGGAGDDLLFASGSGVVSLTGGGGDDILVSGVHTTRLEGGSGADLFVLEPALDPLRITDFEPGLDRLDLSAFAMLRHPGQLEVTPLGHGVQLDYRGTRIMVESASGQPLTLSQLWPDGMFATPDRLLAHTPLLQGTAGNDTLAGTFGGEMIEAGSGRDQVLGHGGNDTIRGEAGRDTLSGGAGDDSLVGGSGPDSLNGATGEDVLAGGAGADVIAAGAGRDSVRGGKGADSLTGGGGRDQLLAGTGNDTVVGGGGGDRIYGQRGDDRLTGGAGADIFVFAEGHGTDRITDFTPGEDRIRFEDVGFGVDDLVLAADGGGTRILSAAGEILLDGTAPDQIGAADFLFV